MIYVHGYVFGSNLDGSNLEDTMGTGTVYSIKENLSVSELKDILKNKLEFSNINLNEILIEKIPPIKISLSEFIEDVNFSSRVNFY